MSPAPSPSDSRVPQVLVGTLVPTLLGTIFTFGRLYTRGFILKNWGYDDSCVAVAWVGSIILAAINGVLTQNGLGHHVKFTSKSDVASSLRIGYSAQLVYQFVLFITKIGICLFYIRIFQDRQAKKTVYWMIGFLLMTFIPVEFVAAFRCHPISDAWKLGGSHCLAANLIILTSAICNILADLLLMSFAIPRIFGLQMAQRQKAYLIAVASLGLLVIIAAAVRVSRAITLSTNKDVTWDGYDKAIWSSIEINTGIFCASAPCIRPLLRKITPGFLSTSSAPTDYKSGRTAQPSGTYGRKSTRLSKLGSQQHSGPFELHSRSDIELPNGANTATCWDGRKKAADKDDDTGSENSILRGDMKEILRDNKKGKNIIKTVSVSISKRPTSKRHHNGPSRDSSVRGLEHV